MSRHRFIWLPDQPIDHGAGFSSLRGAPPRRETEGVNRWVLARGVFDMPEGATDAEIAISVDGRYRLWLNGMPIGRGPVRATPAFQRYDAHDITEHVRPGRNVVAVLIHVPGIDLAWYETMRGGWQPVFGDGGLHVRIRVDGPGLSTEAEADESWRIVESRAWRRDAPRAGWGQDFIEDFDARELDPAWIAPDHDDSGWPHARIMRSVGSEAELARGWGVVEPFPALLRSELPPPEEHEVAPSAWLWTRPVAPRPDLPVDRRLYEERLDAPDPALANDAHALLRDGGAGAVIRTAAGRDTALLLRFDPYHTGRPFFEIEANGGETIEVAVAEAMPGEQGRGEVGDGLRAEGHHGCARVLRYVARPGRQRFESFNWTAVRAMQIVVRNSPDGVRLIRAGSIATRYRTAEEGAFACPDALLDHLWRVGRHTVRQCMHDAWVDCPGREVRQWIGDAVVQFDVAVRALGPGVFPLHRQFLMHVAESQRSDGLARMFAPGDISTDGLTIPDFTLLWIIGAERYWMESGETATIDTIMPSMERAIGWCERMRNANDLIADVPQWHFIEWAAVGRSGEAAAFNALQVGALAALARMADAVERPRLGARCRAMAAETAASLTSRHWNEARGCYVDSVDPESGAQAPRVSQHANALMLLFEIGPRERWPRILAAITDRSRLKLTAAPPIVPVGEPFDAKRDVVRANSFFLHFVYGGIARAGGFAWVVEDMRDAYGPMLATGTSTLWESFHPGASLCHGFSATPTWQLSANALGIAPIEPGFTAFRVAPDRGGLTAARGTVPTPHGPIAVDWWTAEGRMHLRVEYPGACRMVVEDRPGQSLLSRFDEDGTAELEFGVT